MARFLLLLALCLPSLVATSAIAQEQAALIADSIAVTANGELRAEGHVEVLYKGSRLRASAITYSSDRETITIEGPMSLSSGDGFVLIADEAELSADLRDGILESARLVLNQQLQVAAAEIRRVDGRYTQLFRAVASTCPVCDNSDVPLWQIRASRAIHDRELRRMYYYNAVFEVAGLPIFYVPRLQMPDATVERASGFLLPSLTSSTALGSGAKLPYFWAINDQSDLTVTAFGTPQTKTLGLAYRQLLRRGAVSVSGAVSDDRLTDASARGFLFARGVFFLPRDYRFDFDLAAASDDSYLFDYGISTQDRLRSDVSLTRVQRSSYFSAAASRFVSFRDEESAGTTPTLISQLEQIGTFTPPVVGGTARYKLEGFGLVRASDADIVGRDYGRLSGAFGWTRTAVLPGGFLLKGDANLALDNYSIQGDSTVSDQTLLTSTGAVTMSWPLARTRTGGAREVLEPVIQLVFSDAAAPSVPNEESTLVEFDEGSLWSLDRLPGSSAYETGQRANVGVNWTREAPEGWSTTVTLGQVFRSADPDQLNPATGLQGYASNVLAAAQIDFGNGLDVMTRLLIEPDGRLTRNDTRLSYTRGDVGVDTSFLWHVAEPEVGRDGDTWEGFAGTHFRLSPTWRTKAELRYDFATGRAAAAALDFFYEGQCITVDFGATRTFTSSDSVEPQTAYTISLSVPSAAVASSRPKLQCRG